MPCFTVCVGEIGEILPCLPSLSPSRPEAARDLCVEAQGESTVQLKSTPLSLPFHFVLFHIFIAQVG